MRTAFATASIVLAVLSAIPYIRSVLNGRTVPHQLTWLVFTIMNTMVLVSQFLEGGRESILISLVFTLGSATVLVLSWFKGTRGTSRFDLFLFGFAMFAMVAWALSRSNALAIWLTLIIDIAATAMTVLKVQAQPRSEDPLPWAIGTLAYVCSCLTLVGLPLGILYVRPIYGLLSEFAVVAAVFLYRPRISKSSLS